MSGASRLVSKAWSWAASACAGLVALAAIAVVALYTQGALTAERLDRAGRALRGELPAAPQIVERFPSGVEEEVRLTREAFEADVRRRREELTALGSYLASKQADQDRERKELDAGRVRLAADRREYEAARAATAAAERDASFQQNLRLLERLGPEEAAARLAPWPTEEAARYLRGLRDRTAARLFSALAARNPRAADALERVLRSEAASPPPPPGR
ncbi:MAG: hypothetical protein HYZ53_21210 [Planctomycetes bacterium]|nr:hypothetical protein [Planctomycetota bacterium]